MPVASGAIVVELLDEKRYRATCPLFPDCEAFAPTEEAARLALETSIDRLLQERTEPQTGESTATGRWVPTSMNPIDALFQRLRSQGRKAFIPFVTAGDPDLDTTTHLIRELAARGASLIEIGFPYSDPIADGPVIQASYTRALSRGVRIDDIFRVIGQITGIPPLACMISYALVHRRGYEAFLTQAQAAGFSGAIVPDLPVEEADDLARVAAARDFKLIQLVTPTTPRDRALRIARSSTGFLYYVSVAGITGERDQLPADLVGQLRWLRSQTELPICVGFGISKPEHVRLLRDVADGIIVGSALVRRLEQAGTRPLPEIVREMGSLAQSLSEALNPG
jgi:tryptophan synthase alpha chain